MESCSAWREWTFSSAQSERLDKYIATVYGDASRAEIQRWIKAGNIKVNGQQVKANYKLQNEDHIGLHVPPSPETEIQPEAMDMNIIYVDEDVVVVNKPKGMVVHPAPGHTSGTLVNGLLAQFEDLSDMNGALRPGIVHRLDKDTSGLLMVARNNAAHLSLAEQLKAHSVTRRYVALVHGSLNHEKGTVDAPIGRHQTRRTEMDIVAGGKQATTHFRVLERFAQHTLLELELETGRTHQIRVHMKYIGHPLVGDPLYGSRSSSSISGQALHAKMLGFTHPRSREKMMFKSDLPKDMDRALQCLRRGEPFQ